MTVSQTAGAPKERSSSSGDNSNDAAVENSGGEGGEEEGAEEKKEPEYLFVHDVDGAVVRNSELIMSGEGADILMWFSKSPLVYSGKMKTEKYLEKFWNDREEISNGLLSCAKNGVLHDRFISLKNPVFEDGKLTYQLTFMNVSNNNDE